MATGLILEGVSATGKSTLFQLLQEHPAFVAREAKMALPEAYTERSIEHLTHVDLEASLLLLTHLTDTVGGLDRRWSESQFGRGNHELLALAFLFERFHLSHAVWYNSGRFAAYRSIDEILRFLGGRLVLCVVEEGSIPEKIASTRLLRDRQWREYLDERIATPALTMDPSEDDRRVVIFNLRQQKEMLAMATQSLLPTLILDTTHGEWLKYAEQIVRFWGLV